MEPGCYRNVTRSGARRLRARVCNVRGICECDYAPGSFKYAFNDNTHVSQTWSSYGPTFPRWRGVVFSAKLQLVVTSGPARSGRAGP